MAAQDINFEKLLEDSVDQLNQYAEGNKEHIEIVTYKLEESLKIDIAIVKQLRKDLGATQKIFGNVMGVSARTVEAWEIGRSTPNGSAARLMQLMVQNPSLKDSFKKTIEKGKLNEREKHLV